MTPSISTSLDTPPQDRVTRRQQVVSAQPMTQPKRRVRRSPQPEKKVYSRDSRRAVVRHVARWVTGFVMASALVTLTSPYFLSSLRVYEWSAELDDHIIKPGYVHRNRDEGWSTTHYGSFGLHNAAGLESFAGPTILIWGDSYVEAHQVNDDQKMDFAVNAILSERGMGRPRAVAIGRSYWSIADYYFNIPKYEQLLHPACHFIVLAEHGLKDLCPDGETFLSEPTYEFLGRSIVDSGKSEVIAELHEYGLCDAVLAPWKAVRSVLKDVRTSRFALGPANSQEQDGSADGVSFLFRAETPERITRSWEYAVEKLTSATNKPVVFVLVPEVPYLENGRVCLEDTQAKWRTRLVKLLADKHVGCIDMTETLIDDYRETGQFSRGFHHGRPGRGHLNARGHRLVAQQICTYLAGCGNGQ